MKKFLSGSAAKARLDFSAALRAILADIAARVPELDHLEPARIIVTFGQARKNSRATIRPYAFAETSTRKSENGVLYKPIVKIGGKNMRYEITLRPLFFLRSTAADRLRTIFHELYHLSRAFDGTLDRTRRHDVMPRSAFDKALRPMIKRYSASMPAWVGDVLQFDGEVMILQWLERPPNRYRPGKLVKRRYTEKDLFMGPMIMKTK